MRKGADCLSKWVGESERQLRLLFDQVILFSVSVFNMFIYHSYAKYTRKFKILALK